MQISNGVRKIFAIFLFLLAPLAVFSMTSDVTVNNQSAYDVPSGASKVLILDLTLPENLSSIKMINLGTAQQWDISAVYLLEDGVSAGFDGDEREIFRKSSSPFWDTEMSAVSANPRIFVTVDIASGVSGKTIKPQATINSDKTITGFERTVLAGVSMPDVPIAPLARFGEAISSSIIRWNFLELANNEFGFRIKDASLKTKAEVLQINLSYIDETGLSPDTCYSGRRVVAFNDRGEGSFSANFAEVCTPKAPSLPVPAPVVEAPVVAETPVTEEIPAPAEPPAAEAPFIKKPVIKEPIIDKPPVKKPVVEKPLVEESPKIESTSTPKTSNSLFEAVKSFFKNLFKFIWR